MTENLGTSAEVGISEKALALIVESPSSVSAQVLARKALGITQVPESLARKLIKRLLAGEPRVVEEPSGRWRLADTGLEHLPLGKLTFTVVDVETTGSSPVDDRITELAAIRVKGGRVVDEFASLVNPERSVPGEITRLTGISSEMVRRAPSGRQVLGAFRRFMGSSVFVAHNVGFDWAFVDQGLKLAGYKELSGPTLCTLLMSRRFFPGLRSHGLDALAERLKVRVQDRHRARGDARTAAGFLVKFLRLLKFEDVTSLAEVRIFLRAGNILQANPHFSLAQLRKLPGSAGVYLCLNVQQAPIYIAPAEDIRKSVYDLFQAQGGLSNRLRKLIRHVSDIRTETLPGFEVARVRARELIKKWRPPYNPSRLPGAKPAAPAEPR